MLRWGKSGRLYARTAEAYDDPGWNIEWLSTPVGKDDGMRGPQVGSPAKRSCSRNDAFPEGNAEGTESTERRKDPIDEQRSASSYRGA
jgi:hypothetical protein